MMNQMMASRSAVVNNDNEIDFSKLNVANLPFPVVDAPYFNTILERGQYTAKEREALAYYRAHGYLIVEEPILDETEAKAIIEHVRGRTPRGENRLQDAWKTSPQVKNVACHETILSLLRTLYGREPIPFQTLSFMRGTEQRTHSDVIHFSSLPARFMCGVWTALEDITINQGPLHYYPSSQALPEFDYYDLGISEELVYPDSPHEGEPNWDNPRTIAKYKLYEEMIERLMKEHGFKREALTLKRGQSLVWASNLCHGGNAIIDGSSSRHSQVTHFHFDGVVPFTPMFSNAGMGEYYLPALVNVRTGESFSRSYNFTPVELQPLNRNNLYRVKLASGQTAVDKPYYEQLAQLKAEVEFHRNESEQLRHTLHGIQESKLWKALQPLQKLRQRM